MATQMPTFVSSTPKKLLIGGEQVESASGETFETINPATGEEIVQVARGGAEDIDRAVRAARAAFEGPWSTFGPGQRQAVLLRLAELVGGPKRPP
jgi:aldehyde dehydrogenase (NAD+)